MVKYLNKLFKRNIRVLLWFFCFIINIMFFYAIYVNYAFYIKLMIGFLSLFYTILVCISSIQGRLFFKFIKEAKIELYKVVWPNRSETFKLVLVVIVIIFFAALFFWFIDSIIIWLVSKLIYLG
ncbi:preprotein translocase subunit SecE [Candidatus Legionella polyplacis]|uniref:preprotein translocase subunit SecE n=1 Tax=Candidatus Legionella polyplacis TaxID=2005262 RepID=UPI000C1EB811|nr:preprotein translocase subunit SecE [Candidatus Legionella polyplacis]ATW01774.1 preprotein translocase subunit SecE [Candidatus Legionella polyplacis]